MIDYLKGWGDNVVAIIIDGELSVVEKPLMKRVLTLDEIFNNGLVTCKWKGEQ